jgi:hypothetical protein
MSGAPREELLTFYYSTVNFWDLDKFSVLVFVKLWLFSRIDSIEVHFVAVHEMNGMPFAS